MTKTKYITFELTENQEEQLPYPSEESYNSALNWYNNQSKKQILQFCEKQGILLDANEENTLVENWAEFAMAAYSWCQHPATTQVIIHQHINLLLALKRLIEGKLLLDDSFHDWTETLILKRLVKNREVLERRY